MKHGQKNLIKKIKKKNQELTMIDHKRHNARKKVTSYVNKEFLYKDKIWFTAGHNYSPSVPLLLPTVIAEVNYFTSLNN